MGNEHLTISNTRVNRFYVGDTVTIVAFVPWYKRIWRKFFPVRAPILIVTSVDRENGVITVSTDD